MQSLIPDEWIEVFEPMQDAAPTSTFEEVKKVLEDDLGKPLEEVFLWFSPKPEASASLAQVHRARLRSTGEIVAVKIQHPQIKQNTAGDLFICEMAGSLCEYIFPNFRYKWAFEETAL